MNNKGFTLIELVVVIVILGILAATVAPKFINLKAEAETSVLHGIKAAMESAGAMVYGKSIVAGNQALSSTHTPKPTITLEDDSSLNINYGYPTSSYNGWKGLLVLDEADFEINVNFDGVVIISPIDLGLVFDERADCVVTYIEATPTDKPVIKVNPCI